MAIGPETREEALQLLEAEKPWTREERLEWAILMRDAWLRRAVLGGAVGEPEPPRRCGTCSHYNAMPPAWGKASYDGECARGVRIGEPGGDEFVPADFACCWYDRKVKEGWDEGCGMR